MAERGGWKLQNLSTSSDPANVRELVFLLLLLFLADFATSGLAYHSLLKARSTSVCGQGHRVQDLGS